MRQLPDRPAQRIAHQQNHQAADQQAPDAASRFGRLPGLAPQQRRDLRLAVGAGGQMGCKLLPFRRSHVARDPGRCCVVSVR